MTTHACMHEMFFEEYVKNGNKKKIKMVMLELQ